MSLTEVKVSEEHELQDKEDMKHSFKFVALISLLALALVNCSKDRIQPPVNTYGSLNQFYSTHRQPEQEYIITSDGQCPLIAQNGLRLCLGRQQLMMPNGDSVQLPYSIKIIELYTAKDMILYNMPTVSGGDLLTTGGQVRIRTFKGTDSLQLRSGQSYFAQVPAVNPTSSMSIFYGVSSNGIIDWSSTVAGGSGGPSNIAIDSSNTFYNLTLPAQGWINCDYFYNYPGQKTQVGFSSSTDDLTNVAKFLWFPNINSLMQVYDDISGDVPVNEPVKIVCFAMDASGNMHSFYQEITIGNNQIVDVTLTPTSENDLLTLLGNL
jgi:hypothetical protein